MGRGRSTRAKQGGREKMSLSDIDDEEELFDDFGDTPVSLQGNACKPLGTRKMDTKDSEREKVHSIKKNGLLPLNEEDKKVSQTEKIVQVQRKKRGRPALNKPKKNRNPGYKGKGRAILFYRRIYESQKLRSAYHAKIRTILKNLTILHKISGKAFKFEAITPRGDTIVYYSPNAASEFQATIDRTISTGKGHVTVISTRDCEKRFKDKKDLHWDVNDPQHPMHADSDYNFASEATQRRGSESLSGPLNLPELEDEDFGNVIDSIFSAEDKYQSDCDSDDDFSDDSDDE